MKKKSDQAASKSKAPSADGGGNSSSTATHAAKHDDPSSRTAERLREYEKVVEGVEEMIVVVDRNYRYLLANRAFLRYRRKEGEDVVGRFIWEVLDPSAFSDIIKPRLDQCFAGHVVNFEMRYVYADSGARDLLVACFPIEGENGVDRVACVLQDITIRKRAEEALKQSEHQMAEAQRLAHVGSWTWDIKSNTVIWSDELYRIFGLQPQKFPATLEGFLGCIHPDDRDRTRSVVEEALKTLKPYADTRRIVRPDGEIRIVEAHGSVVCDDAGIPIRLFGTSQDITEREFVEAALREAKQKYRGILDNLQEGVFQTTPEGRFITVNRALVRMLGFSSEEDLIASRRDIAQQHYVNPADRDEFARQIKDVGKVTGFELEAYRKDGSRIWLSENVRAVRSADGEVTYYEGTAQDITERKQTEEALKQSEHQMAEAQSLAHVGSWTWEIETDVLVWSEELYTIFGENPDSFRPTYTSFLAHVHPDEREATAMAIAQCLEDQRPFSYRRRIVRPDGEIRTIDSHLNIVADPHGKPLRMFGACQDVTESVHVEEARRVAEQKYQEIFENAREGIFRTTPEGHYLVANPALARMHGFDSPADLIRERTDIPRDVYVDPSRRDEFKRYMESDGMVQGFEFQLARKDGATIWVSVNARAVRDEDGKTQYYEGSGEDITERKQAQEALRQSEERYRELFENSRDAIYVHDLSGRYLSVNRAAEELSGYTREEIIGKHYSNFVLPTHLKAVRENFCRKLDVPIETTYETEIACKDGTRRPVEVSSRMIYRNGEPAGVQGTVRDITERKRAQRALQTYSRRLVNAQEAERELIARELHDDIGQSLTAISINLESIHRSGAVQGSAVPRLRESIDVIDNALRRVRELSFELRPALLDDLGLAAALTWYAARFSERTGIRATVKGELPGPESIGRTVETACFRIVQEALTNTARYAQASEASIHVERSNGVLELTISDNGVGFAVDTLVGPGRSTHALGLRGMEERASAVGGRVTISSEQGKGTQVILRVPTSPHRSY